MGMETGTDAARALAFAFADPNHLSAQQVDFVLSASGVSGLHTGKDHPVRMDMGLNTAVPPLKIHQKIARNIAAMHPAGDPHGEMFAKENADLLK